MGKFQIIDLLHSEVEGVLPHSKSKQNTLDNRYDRWGDNIIQNKVYKLNSDISDRVRRHSDVTFISNSKSYAAGDSRSNSGRGNADTSVRRRRSGNVFQAGSNTYGESSREYNSNEGEDFRDSSSSEGDSQHSSRERDSYSSGGHAQESPRTRRDLEGFPTSKEEALCSLNFKSLSVGCTSNEDKMEFISACPNAKEVVSSEFTK